MHWKLSRDRYYSDLFAVAGMDAVLEAGFFLDTSNSDEPLDDVHWLCTPLTKVSRQPCDRPAVIVMTGSMCPVHTGHMELMELARHVAEQAGFTVIGGYLSPGHDEYVAGKTGNANIPASIRVVLCTEALRESSWIDADPWEALHRKVAVNFTDVVVRLERYLTHHLGHHVDVIYACGADNARFALTFAHTGYCVVVGRPGYEDRITKYQAHPLLCDNSRIMWAKGSNIASSTAVRNGDMSMVPPAVRRHLQANRHPVSLILRMEGLEAVGKHIWFPGCHDKILRFQENLEQLLSEHFSGRVSCVSLITQRRRAKTLLQKSQAISLDPLIAADACLAISRRFDLGGYIQLDYTARPGHFPLSMQAECIEPGDYVIFDDDIVTGGTVREAELFLHDGCIRITGHVSLETSDDGRYDVLDSRDFLLGGFEAGLVVTLPNGGLGRAPYVFPYVDPSARASISPDASINFSRRVWMLNAAFFAGSGLLVQHLPSPAMDLILLAGFNRGDHLEDVCKSHMH